MCCADESSQKSKQIDKWLRDVNRGDDREFKILLLGPGESGKSTIFKQMKIISDGGFTQQELQRYTWIIYGNIISQMKAVIAASYRLRIEIQSEEARVRASQVDGLPSGGDSWSPEVALSIRRLWADPGIRETYNYRDQYFQLNDTASYFFEQLERIMTESYVPTLQDVLRARVRTTGIVEARVKFEDMYLRLLDVGGQRSERRKWIHAFDKVAAVLFCASLSEYDQTLREDANVNRMQESLLLFREISNSKYFLKSALILFLNKTDLFDGKIATSPLTICFPEYTGGADKDVAKGFIRSKFEDLVVMPTPNSGRCFTHFTCALSTEQVEFVFSACRANIIRTVFEVSGM